METHQMKSIMRFKSTGVLLALVAVLAMSALTASAASAAAPEFKPSTNQTFTGSSGAVAWESSESKITCSKDTSKGEITGATTMGSVVLTFTECFASKGGTRCYFNSKGAKGKGEIITDKLKGELGEVAESQATSKVGLVLEPEVGTKIAELESPCGDPSIEGGVAAEVTPTKTSGKTLDLVFVGAGGLQKIKKLTKENGLKEYHPKLESDTLGGLSIDFTEALSFEKALEVT